MNTTPAATDPATGSMASSPASRAAPFDPEQGLLPGNPEYRRAGSALFLVGFATFALVYCVQPLLPEFAHSFGITPASSSLALSLTTGTLAISIVLSSAFSQALGRRGMMFVSLIAASLLNIVAAILPSWYGLLLARTLEGLALGGVPAIAMAWLAEEIHPTQLGRSMGLYVAGTAFGGMVGRVGMALITEVASWQVAMAGLGLVCLLCSLGFWRLLPPSRHFTPTPGIQLRFHLRTWWRHLKNPSLLRIYAIGFLLMSVFVALFNYSTFRLSEAPYLLSQTALALIFLVYGFGIVSSSTAGALADRYGKPRLLVCSILIMLIGILTTLSGSVVLIVAGIALLTIGFFASHSVASSSVGPACDGDKGHAASLYLLFYYLGSSVIGSAGGWFWQHGGWPSVVAMAVTLTGGGLLLAALGLKTKRRST
ncbi:MAG: MFS transporter [Lautropia sp.]|nr:MFS transporter [Lautropia sp.]